MVTSAMLRTWAVRLLAMSVDAIGQVLPGAGDAGNLAWPPSLPSVPTSRATRVTSAAKLRNWSTMVLMAVLELEDFTADIDGDFLGQIAVGDRDGHVGDVSDLSGQIAGHQIDVVGQVLPGAGDAGNHGLTAELSFGADLAGDTGDFGGKAFNWSTMVLMASLSWRISPRTSTVIFLDRSPLATAMVTSAMFRTCAVRLPAMILTLSVRSFQAPLTSRTLRLAAELAFGTDLAGDAGHLGGEAPQLVHHGVDGFFELEDLAADIDGDFLGQIAVGDGDGNVGDVSDLSGQVTGHEIDAVVKSFQVPATPGTAAWPPSLPSVPTSRATRVTSDAKLRN